MATTVSNKRCFNDPLNLISQHSRSILACHTKSLWGDGNFCFMQSRCSLAMTYGHIDQKRKGSAKTLFVSWLYQACSDVDLLSMTSSGIYLRAISQVMLKMTIIKM